MATEITEFNKGVQPHVIGCPMQMVNNAVIQTIIKFCEETHVWEKAFEHDFDSSDVDTTDNNSVNVNIESYLEDVRPLLVTEFKIDGATWNTAFIEIENVQDDISEIEVTGAKLFTYPDVTHIKFYGIEEEDDQRFYIKQAYAPIPTITTIDDLFYYRHHEAIKSGALGTLMAMPRKDWSDPVSARHYLGQYNYGVAMAMIRKDHTKGSRRPKSMRFF